jgi:hypothetical protein
MIVSPARIAAEFKPQETTADRAGRLMTGG